MLRLSWSRNGDKLAFLTDQSDLSIFSSQTWDLFGKPLSLHSKPNAVRWSVDNGSAAVGTSDGRVVFYDPEADWNISGEMDGEFLVLSYISLINKFKTLVDKNDFTVQDKFIFNCLFYIFYMLGKHYAHCRIAITSE